MLNERVPMIRCILFGAALIFFYMPCIGFAISADATNYTSTVSTPSQVSATGTVTYRTTVQGQAPTPKTIQTTFRDYKNSSIFRSTFQGTTTTYTSLGLSSTTSCYTLDPIYRSFTNGQAQTFFRFSQDTSSAIIQTPAIGVIYLHANPDDGPSQDYMIGYKKGDGPLIEGKLTGLKAILEPILTALTDAIGAKDWDFSATTTTEPAKYNVQCGYTKPSLQPVSVP